MAETTTGTKTARAYRATCTQCDDFNEITDTEQNANDLADSHGMTAHRDIFARSLRVTVITA